MGGPLDGVRIIEFAGIAPDDCLAVNPRLVYARMTGWGQYGPLALRAGHDINYISITGALHAIGTPAQPLPPLSLVGNFGGGATFLTMGIMAALLRRERSGTGDVLDVAVVDGTCNLLQTVLELHSQDAWTDYRGDNLIDGGAPFYRTYVCADGEHVAVGAIEPQFYALFLAGLGLAETDLPNREDRRQWAVLGQRFADAFKQHPRDHWIEVFADTDACVTPVLSFAEASRHPHIRARMSLSEEPGGITAASAPRFDSSGEHSAAAPAAVARTADLATVLDAWEPLTQPRSRHTS
jgi:alpha-methylacyl-CoA racemase